MPINGNVEMVDPEQDAFRVAGYASGEIPLGTSPAVLVVDCQIGLTENRTRLGGSDHIQRAVDYAEKLIAAARSRSIPIVHTFVAWRSDGKDLGVWALKMPGLSELIEGSPLVEIDPRLYKETDILIHKQKPSAFFGTGLESKLRENGIDTVVVCGLTTSGCVRASIVDSFSYGLRTVVAAQACGDQDSVAHDANLADVYRRYANVWTVDEVVERVFSSSVR